MKGFGMLAALGLWGMFLPVDIKLRLTAGVIWTMFLLFRFKRFFPVLLFSISALLSLNYAQQTAPVQQNPQAGIYEIYRIRDSYCLGRHVESGVKAVFYQLENAVEGSRVQAESFEEIHSLENIGLFSFAKMMNEQGVFYQCSDAEIISRPDSLRTRVYDCFSSHPARELYLWLFYGRSTIGSDSLASLGLPVLGLTALIRRRMQRHMSKKKTQLAVLAFLLLWTSLFPFTVSLARLMIFEFCRLLFKQHHHRWPASVIIFLLFFPHDALSFSFVLPVLLSLTGQFQKTAGQRKICSWIVCSILQILYFQGLNPLLLFGFSFGRTLLGHAAAAAMIALPFPAAGLKILELIQMANLNFEGLCFEGTPGLISSFLMCIALLSLCFGADRRRIRLALASIGFYLLSFRLDPFFHVYMLSIGQGDCTLIVEPFQKSAVMIDAAGNLGRDNAEKIIIPFLKSRRIKELDALILTHSDFDHNGAAESLTEKFPVKKVIEDPEQADGDAVGISWPFYSLSTQLQSDAKLEEDQNDTSIVTWFSYDGFSYLWTGDASKKVEEQLMDSYALKSDILKLGHHGSNTSSDPAFLREVLPQLSLISCGTNNRYGHPHAESLNAAIQAGSDLLQTDVSGMIHLKTLPGIMIGECADGTLFLLHPDQTKTKD